MADADTSLKTFGEKGYTSRGLLKAIFDAPSPEQAVRTVPAQSLFLVLRQTGLSACTELLEIASSEQLRLIIDFDLWEKDRFREERFWEWLSLGDEEDGLRMLQKIVQSIDLKLIGLLISRYVDVQTFDEPTEAPPAAGFHTPDKGHTWLSIKLEDGTQHFLFGRLLAMVFETNAELFYQLLSIPGVATDSMLEEEAYAERGKRIAAEGIPETDTAAQLHAPLAAIEPTKVPELVSDRIAVNELHAVEPLLYDTHCPQPLAELLALPTYREQIETEISFIINAAVVFFGIDVGDTEEVLFWGEKVKGALNVGLASAAAALNLTPVETYRHLGMKSIYRHGLSHMLGLRKQSSQLLRASPELQETDPTLHVLRGLSDRLPHMPRFFAEMSAVKASPLTSITHLDVAPQAILDLASVTKAKGFIAYLSSALKKH